LIIDEAGMADTLSLDAAVQFAIDRGANVRLVGDDQQLAAIDPPQRMGCVGTRVVEIGWGYVEQVVGAEHDG
jgi:hypothetical protein